MIQKLLPEVCHIQYGFPFDSKRFSNKEGTPLIRIRDVVRGYTETFTTEQCRDDYTVKKVDILIGMDGMFNVAKWNGNTAYLNQRVCKLEPKSSIVANYLFYYLPCALKKIENKTAFVTVKHLKAKQLNSILIPYPSIKEQEKIAQTLDLLFRLIYKKKKQLNSLDELVKSRFLEMISVDKGWPLVKLDTLCDSIVRGPFGSALKVSFFVEKGPDTVKVYEQKNAIQRSAKLGESYVTQDKYQELKRFSCGPGDFIMSCSGTIGCLYQIPEGAESGIINQALCKFHLNGKMLPEVFLTYMRNSVDQIETKGSGIKNIGAVSYIKNMEIALPPIEVQQQFAEFINQSDKSKMAVQRSLDELETLKKSLMQTYFG